MIVDIGYYPNIDTEKEYIVTTKYPYVLKPILKGIKVSAMIYDWHIATKLHDVLSEYSRLKQIDPTIPPIDELTFVVFKDVEFKEIVLADYYIEDITEDINSGS